MRTKHASLVPLFMAAEEVVKVKGEVGDILNRYGAVVVEEDHAEACFKGLGQETISPVFCAL